MPLHNWDLEGLMPYLLWDGGKKHNSLGILFLLVILGSEIIVV